MFKKRTSKVVESKILSGARATPETQQEVRQLNKWLRNWCKKEGLVFMENWDDFAVRY